MSTTIRPELSAKNKYWIEKHRYYELKHFCLQYPIWKKAHASLNGLSQKSIESTSSRTNVINDPTVKCAEARMYYSDRMQIIEQAALETDSYLYSYILKGVTEEIPYAHLKSRLEIPCCRGTYYELYRRFFWILNKTRK